jgi:hypothetical protein
MIFPFVFAPSCRSDERFTGDQGKPAATLAGT